ncbi:GNAT family N-acetyltransferase [Agrobacterium sp. 22-226-1]
MTPLGDKGAISNLMGAASGYGQPKTQSVNRTGMLHTANSDAAGGQSMIRRAKLEDEAQIRSCAEQAYARYIPSMGRKPAPMVADFAAQIAAGQVYISTGQDGTFRGFIVFYRQDDYLMLENVAVLPGAAGGGVGKELILFCENAARDLGVGAVQLYTNEKMIANLSIYPKLGYVEVARRTENGFNRVYFEKRLT